MLLNYIRFSCNDPIPVPSQGRKTPLFVNASSHLYGEIHPLESEHRFPIGKFGQVAVFYRKSLNSYTIRNSYSIGISKTPIGNFRRIPNSYRKHNVRNIAYRKTSISYRKFQTYSRLFAFGNVGDQGGAG